MLILEEKSEMGDEDIELAASECFKENCSVSCMPASDSLRAGRFTLRRNWINLATTLFAGYVPPAMLTVNKAPPSPDYVPSPEHLPSPDYVPGPEEPKQAPPSPEYVPEPVHPEYLAPSDDDIPDNLEEDHADYPANEGDEEEEESFEDDVDDKDEEEACKEEDNDEKEEEHLAPADSSVVPIDDHVPSAEDTEAFETDKSAPTPTSPRPRKARISVRLEPPMAASMEARIAEYAIAPTPPSPLPSPLSPLSSPLPQIPSPPLPLPSPPLPLPTSSSPLLLPATDHGEDIPKADFPSWKRLCLTAPTPRFEIEESSTTVVARQAERPMSR
ncbi:hypothetical protein Tco_0733893 [Tanacetum coccineum]